MVTVLVLSGVVIVTMLKLRRALFAIVLDEPSARVAGIPVDALNDLLAALTAVTVVAAMRIVGVLLVAALMLLPVGAAQLLARSFRGSLAVAVAVAVAVALACVVLGLAASGVWDLPPGGTIVLVAAAAFGVSAAFSGRVGPRRAP